MKVYAISDLHLSSVAQKPMDIFGSSWELYWQTIEQDWQQNVEDDDIVLISGDISWAMKIDEAIPDFDLIKKLKGTKIIIRGNHDYWWQSLTKVRQMIGKDIVALQNDSVKIGNYIFCGTRGWQVPEKVFDNEEDEKIYKREVIRFEMALKDAKAKQKNGEKIIALLHYPPFNSNFENSDFTTLAEEYGVSVVVYGHLHGDKCKSKLKLTKNSVLYLLTSCDKINNKLVKVSE